MNPNTKKLIGAVVAAALAIAVYYGVISQQQAGNIQSQANQTLGTTPASQQTTAPASQQTTSSAPQNLPAPTGAPAGPTPRDTAPAAQH